MVFAFYRQTANLPICLGRSVANAFSISHVFVCQSVLVLFRAGCYPHAGNALTEGSIRNVIAKRCAFYQRHTIIFPCFLTSIIAHASSGNSDSGRLIACARSALCIFFIRTIRKHIFLTSSSSDVCERADFNGLFHGYHSICFVLV